MWALRNAAALFGLFLGALIFGRVADRIGRQKIFAASFMLITVATAAQFFVNEPCQLLVLRILMGLGIGGDYAVDHTMLAEILPRKRRGEILGSFSVIWTFGYVLATILGIALMQSQIDDAWRWMLVAPALVAAIVLVARLGTPESPRWLVDQGREKEAREVLDKHFGTHVTIAPTPSDEAQSSGFGILFSPTYIRRTIFNCVFFACLVAPVAVLVNLLGMAYWWRPVW